MIIERLTKLFQPLCGTGGALILAALTASQVCAGLTFEVTTTNDSGPGSLRQAVLNSNAAPATPNTIDFQLGAGPKIISLSSSLIITSDVTINGPGASQLGIVAQQSFDAFYVPVGQTITFSGMTVANGLNGFEANGTITVNSSAFIGNLLSGVALDVGTTASVSYSTFAENSTGLFLGIGGTASVLNSTANDNSIGFSAGGGSTLTLIDSTSAANSQGLVSNGGVTLFVNDDTVSGNRTAGIAITYSDTLLIGNTIVASNCGGDVQGDGFIQDEGHNLISNGDGTAFAGQNGVNGDIVGATARPIDPKLGPLAFNGGPTATEALEPGSPAINAGNNAIIPTGITFDQRGPGYPRIENNLVDIGAYESHNSSGSGCNR